MPRYINFTIAQTSTFSFLFFSIRPFSHSSDSLWLHTFIWTEHSHWIYVIRLVKDCILRKLQVTSRAMIFDHINQDLLSSVMLFTSMNSDSDVTRLIKPSYFKYYSGKVCSLWGLTLPKIHRKKVQITVVRNWILYRKYASAYIFPTSGARGLQR